MHPLQPSLALPWPWVRPALGYLGVQPICLSISFLGMPCGWSLAVELHLQVLRMIDYVWILGSLIIRLAPLHVHMAPLPAHMAHVMHSLGH
jgi:hypothetical protein